MTFLERAKKVIPRAASTNSKSYTQFGEGVYPTHFTSASGCRIVDTEGKGYWDFISSLGSNILGYQRVWDNESSYPSASLPSWREAELAEELVKRIPFAHMWKYATNGVDVTTCAIKLARAFTGKMQFISCGYHGIWEGFSCIMPINGGTNPKLKEDIIEYKFEDLEQLCIDLEEENSPDICAVIIEYPPISPDDWKRVKTLSQRLQTACNKLGVVLIIDEVLTFLRAYKWCISNELELTPDIICLGKALGNGYPISAIGGREDLMQQMGESGTVFMSNTFSGFDISLSSSINCLASYDLVGAYTKILEFGRDMIKMINSVGAPFEFHAEGNSFRIKAKHSETIKERILGEQLVKRGFLTMPSGYMMPNYAHTQELKMEYITEVFKAAMEASMTAKLEGVDDKPLLLQNR